tara:strand:+ start:1549 stop:1788 length:240 start_codon:yes stop_codon:yes gene_type:complete
MVSKRCIGLVEKVLMEEEQMNTHEIMDAIKSRWPKFCPMMRELTNVLGRNPQFIKVGMTGNTMVTTNSSYAVCIWELRR